MWFFICNDLYSVTVFSVRISFAPPNWFNVLYVIVLLFIINVLIFYQCTYLLSVIMFLVILLSRTFRRFFVVYNDLFGFNFSQCWNHFERRNDLNDLYGALKFFTLFVYKHYLFLLFTQCSSHFQRHIDCIVSYNVFSIPN